MAVRLRVLVAQAGDVLQSAKTDKLHKGAGWIAPVVSVRLTDSKMQSASQQWTSRHPTRSQYEEVRDSAGCLEFAPFPKSLENRPESLPKFV